DFLALNLAGLIEVDPENIDAACLFRQQSNDRAGQNGFPGPGSADKPQNLATINVERNAVEDPVAFEIDDEVTDLDHRRLRIRRHVTFRWRRRTWQKCRRGR